MDYIITKNKEFFLKIGNYNFCSLEDMDLPDEIAIDTETTGLTPRNCDVFCVQIGTGKDNYIIVMYDGNYEFSDIVPYIKDKILVGHNLTFDLGFFYKYGFFPKRVKDTMIASKILYNGQVERKMTKDGEKFLPMANTFGACMARELDIVYDKTDQKNIHIVKLSQESTIKYSFNDVDRELELKDALEVKIDTGGFRETYDLHCEYIKVLAYIEQCGLPLSSEAWSNKMATDVKNQTEWGNKIREYIYDNLPKYAERQIDIFSTAKKITVSLTSPSQMVKVFNDFGIPTLDKEGKDSISEEVISKSKHEFVSMWLNYQEANHRVTTFGQKILDRIEDGRVYSSFNPAVDTARLSVRKGEINFLNFPSDKETRKCFIATKGHSIVVCDWSGQETVIAADISGDEAMTKSVVDGADLHCLLARVLFPELEPLSDEEIIKNHKDKRQASKAPRFAFQYGGNAFTIHQKEGIPYDRALEIETGFKQLHEGLYKWGGEKLEESLKNGYIESADGWKLALPMFDRYKSLKEGMDKFTKDHWQQYRVGKQESKNKWAAKDKGENYEVKFLDAYRFYKDHKPSVSKYFKLRSEYQRLCLNNPVQARGAHQMKKASVMLFNWIVENNLLWKVRICNSIYDELVLEVKNMYTERAKDKLSECMITGGNHYLKNLTIQADAHYGDCWYSAKG